jgi:deazaflavin-dependent oxidoreductase (nitroreductase family)
MSDWNSNIIEEFRENGGAVGGPFAGRPLLLLHTTGARSGRHRVNPLMYQRVGAAYAVFGSKGGSDANPDWYHNLLANPEASVEVTDEHFAVTARVLDGSEREPIWEKQKRDFPMFADYEHKTNRTIPVVMLEPRR